jgi:hypothetical protein
MQHACTRCNRPHTFSDLALDEFEDMETQRQQAGLDGVRFLYFHCSACAMDDIFVAVLPLEEEPAEEFEARYDTMEEVVRSIHADGIAAAVVAVNES